LYAFSNSFLWNDSICGFNFTSLGLNRADVVQLKHILLKGYGEMSFFYFKRLDCVNYDNYVNHIFSVNTDVTYIKQLLVFLSKPISTYNHRIPNYYILRDVEAFVKFREELIGFLISRNLPQHVISTVDAKCAEIHQMLAEPDIDLDLMVDPSGFRKVIIEY
jgi:hypothetical protein